MFLEPVAGLLKFPKVCKILGSSNRYLLHLLQLQKKQPSNHNLGFARQVWTFVITANITYWHIEVSLRHSISHHSSKLTLTDESIHNLMWKQNLLEQVFLLISMCIKMFLQIPRLTCFSDFSYCLKLGKHDCRNWNCVDFFLRIRLQGFWSSMGKAASYLDEIKHGVFELHILWHAPHAVRTRHGCRFTHCSSTLPAPHRWLFFNRSARSRIGFLRCGLNTC